MSRLELLLRHICTARSYTEDLLEHIQADDWFCQPSQGLNHVAWLVGHLAVAEFRLTMYRIRGNRADDGQLLPASFSSLFGKGSAPEPEPSKNPSPTEIREVFDRVHQQALRELGNVTDEVLDQPVDEPHRMFKTKLEALLFCGQHEMLHAGQIALLRRLRGHASLR